MAEQILDLAWLSRLHAEKRLMLATSDKSGFVYYQVENPLDEVQAPLAEAAHRYVAELIRLATIGQGLELATAEAVKVGAGQPMGAQ